MPAADGDGRACAGSRVFAARPHSYHGGHVPTSIYRPGLKATLTASQSARFGPSGGESGEVGLAEGFGEALDCVAEHSTRHLAVMRVEERFFNSLIPFADFAEHPADRFVDQVFPVVQQDAGDVKRSGEVALLDIVESSEDGNAALPEEGRVGERAERLAVTVLQVRTNDVFRRRVYQVPVVDESGVGEVEVVDLMPGGCIGSAIEFDEDQKGEQAFLVERGVEEFDGVRKRQGSKLPGDPA